MERREGGKENEWENKAEEDVDKEMVYEGYVKKENKSRRRKKIRHVGKEERKLPERTGRRVLEGRDEK